MTLVAISQRVDVHRERGETRDALDQRLAAFVREAGGVPIPVPNALADGIAGWLDLVRPQAIVLSGGNDIGGRIERDATEEALLNYASTGKRPVLGICRGMQFMGLWAGVELKHADGHIRTRHRLSGSVGGEVNSYHHMTLASCPQGFSVLARSEDGEIEAIGDHTRAWEGWMWHPEREPAFEARDVWRLRALLR